MSIFVPIGDLPICEIISGGPVDTSGVFIASLRSQRAGRILLDVTLVSQGDGYISTVTAMPIADFPICDFPEISVPQVAQNYLFADAEWDGKPNDAYYPNRLAIPAIGSAADVERQIPVSPDSSRRGDVSLGSYEFKNPGGYLDYLLELSPGDQSVIGRYVFEDDDSGNGRILFQGIGDQWEADLDVIRLLVKSSSSYLDQPAWLRKYTGSGGLTGDPAISGQIVPACFGNCFNIPPVLIVRDYWLFQFHDGPAFAVDAVKEGGLPFTFMADLATLDELLAYAFTDTGQYATCLALGVFRVSLTSLGPAKPITADVRGHAPASGYTERLGEILSGLAIERGTLTTSLLDVNSFAQMPTGACGFYTAQADLSISDIYNAMLGGINGWYGSDRFRLLRAGYIDEPQGKGAAFTITEDETINIERISLPDPARWKQSVTYGQNFSPMAEADVSVLLPSNERDRLKAASLPLERQSGATKVRQKSAIVGNPVKTYFRDAADAQIVLDRMMALYQEPRTLYRVTMWRTGYQINMQDYVMIINSRHNFAAGKMFVVVGLRDAGNSDQVVITVYG